MAKGNRGGQGYAKSKNKTSKGSFSQAELKSDYENNPYDIDNMFKLANKYTTESANENNFFENSIGEWDLKSRKPNGEADYISYTRTGKISSEYWYTKEGVYRRSNHWGVDVASCSWFIKGRKYDNSGVVKGKREVAFIKWSDLKAKATIVTINTYTVGIKPNLKVGDYTALGGKFSKNYWG